MKFNFLQKPASFEERMDLEKHVEKLRGKPPAKEATSLLAGILRSLHTQRAKEANALIQAIRPYLDDPDLRATYLARVILLRTATPEHILDVLSYSELPKLKFTDLAEFHLDSTDLPDIFAGDESKTLITKYLADPAVQKKLLELAKSSDPKFQETLPKLLCHADRLPGELIDTLFSRNFQANAETISRWLDSYSTDPIPVSSAALTILARTKDEAVRKAIVNWFQNCKPSFLDRQRLQMRVRERCEELMKDPDAAPNVVPVLILFARFPQEWKQYAKHPHPRVRHLVLERLAEDPRTGVEALIPHLTIPQDQEKAKELLRQMFDKHGAIAIEPTILSQLNLASKTNPIIILPLLEILRDKGTARCLPALQLFTKYPNQQIAKMAQAAIVEIKKRGL